MQEITDIRKAAEHLRAAAHTGWAVIRNNALADVLDAIAARAEEVLDTLPYSTNGVATSTALAIVSGSVTGFDSAVRLSRHINNDKDED